MCGIVSIINREYIYEKEKIFLKGMNRGPESHKEYNFQDVWFGFHRLAINGLNDLSDQPFVIDNIILICNGEIYNYKELYKSLNIEPNTNSDCEVIIHLYKKFGMDYTLKVLDGYFSFILCDSNLDAPKIFVARDSFGVRPLYETTIKMFGKKDIFGFASELKVLNEMNCSTIQQFTPGTYKEFRHTNYGYEDHHWEFVREERYFNIPKVVKKETELSEYLKSIYFNLENAVKKRVCGTCERNIACLLSGGLDSSIICSLVKKYYTGTLHTYSIGMKGSEDLNYAKIVSQHIGSTHHEIIVSQEDFLQTIPIVIHSIESYDTTTVRASVGNYLIGKYISENSDSKVIFNGDGSDEVTGGYIYLLNAPDDITFDYECRNLLNQIHYFDVLRSDKCISSHGLEPRTPFLDTTFVQDYMSIPEKIRNPRSKWNMENTLWDTMEETKKRPEKLLLRYSIQYMNPSLLPKEVLWRTKEAFSDGVSGENGSWYNIIKESMKGYEKNTDYTFNPPTTPEQSYYRDIFEKEYKGHASSIPYFWMPKFVDAVDPSARTLSIYKT